MSATPVGVINPGAEPATKPERYLGLDGARGIAALGVVCAHFLDALTIKAQFINHTVFNLGVFGVIAFFIISGFVISKSLESTTSLKAFWINRFFRLYPAYWIALFLALGFAIVSQIFNLGLFFDLKNMGHIGDFLANLTMIQMWLGKPNLLPVAWTLNYEMLFYGFCSLIFAFRWKYASELILVAISVYFLSCLTGLYPATAARTFQMMFAIGSFLIGVMLYKAQSKPDEAVRSFGFIALFWISAAIGWAYYLLVYWYPGKWPIDTWATPPTEFLSWVGGHLFIFGVLYFKNWKVPKVLVYFGTVSYTLYLFHGFGILFLPHGSVVIRSIVYWGWVIFVTPILYGVIEKPTIKMGRDLSRKFAPAKPKVS